MSSYDRGHFRRIDRVLLILRSKKFDSGEAVVVRKSFLEDLILSSAKYWIEENQGEGVFKADSNVCLVLWFF